MHNELRQLGLESVNPGGFCGDWTGGGEKIDSVSPIDGKPLAAVKQVTPQEYDRIVDRAHAAFLKWRQVPAPVRGETVRQLGDALRKHKADLGALVTLENGKIRAEGEGEVQEMIDICDFAVGLSRQLYGLTMHSERPGHRMYEQWHPLGIVGVITAFNFPVAVWSWNATIAAVCGDTLIWKPSSLTPLAAVAVQHICNQVMADHGLPGIFNLVIGTGRDVGELLLNDNQVGLISFTGSTKIGRTVSESVARRFGRTILELGGNNAIIVAEDADLDMATRAIVFGAVGTAGQRCTTTRRIIVQRSIAGDLTERLVNAYSQVRLGDPLDDDTLMGPLLPRTAVEEMFEALEQARTEGGEIVAGGKMRPDLGKNFVEPTIVRMPAQTDIAKQETFEPILWLLAGRG